MAPELHLADKFEAEADILVITLDHLRDDASDQALTMALAQAKRVRKASTLLVQALASERDNRYSRGGTSE